MGCWGALGLSLCEFPLGQKEEELMDTQSHCSMDLGELWPELYLPEIPGADLDMVSRVGMQAETVWVQETSVWSTARVYGASSN